jgi:xylulokinase
MTQSPSASGPLIVGLDMGSTSVKALVYEPSGRAVAKACVPASIHYPRPGWAFYDPNELWSQAVEVLRDALAQIDDPRRIAGIAVTSVGEAGVLLDTNGAAVHESIAWFDQRTLKQHEWISGAVGWERLSAITGLASAPIYSVLKQLWIKENAPEAWSRAVRWLHVADFVAYMLSGEQATDWSIASRTLAFDLRKREWSAEILDAAGIDRNLFAPLVPSGTPIGKVTAGAASATGLPETTIVSTGGHDHICGALAAGITRPGNVLDSFGTAEVVMLSLDRPIDSPELERAGYCQGSHVVEGLSYVYGGLFTAGGSVNWWKDILGADHETLIADASAAPAGSQGVCFLPHLRMGDSPHLDPRSRGAFVGLTADVRQSDLARAVFEGVSLEAKTSLDPLLMLAGIDHIDNVTLIGGGARNDLLTQIKASIFNARVRVLDLDEETALGAAILAGIGAGVYRDAQHALETIETTPTFVEPVFADVQTYDDYYRQVFLPLYDSLRDVNHAIYELAHGETDSTHQAGE